MPYRTFRATRNVQIGSEGGPLYFPERTFVQFDGEHVAMDGVAYPARWLRGAINVRWLVLVPGAQQLPQPVDLADPPTVVARLDPEPEPEPYPSAWERVAGEDPF